MSDSVRPHRWQPTRLPHPWDSPGKNNGVGCHFLLQCMKVKSQSEITQSCPTLSDPREPSRLLRPWDFPGKSTGVGCHCLLRETRRVTGKFDLGVQNETGQSLIEFCQENTLVIANTLFQQHKRRHVSMSTHGHHQMVNTEIRLIIFFAAKDGEALYRQRKQDQELTVAQIINSLLPNSD